MERREGIYTWHPMAHIQALPCHLSGVWVGRSGQKVGKVVGNTPGFPKGC